MNKVIKWIVVIFIAIVVLALIFGGREEQISESAENTTDSTVSITDSTDTEQSEPSDAEEGVSESTTDLLKAYEDNEIKDNRVQKEHAQSQWRGNDE